MENKLFEQSRLFWDQEVQRGNLIYPNEQVISFVKRNFNNPKETTILDFGCGAGRDTVALLSEGYNMIAMDYNESALRMVKNKCTCLREGVRIVQNKGFEVPLQENAVDAVIADGSLFLYSKEELIHLIANLGHAMKHEALLWANFRTPRDSLYYTSNNRATINSWFHVVAKKTHLGD